MCCETEPSLALYPSIEMGKAFKASGYDVAVVIPSYEFRKLGIMKKEDVDFSRMCTRKVLDRFGFDIYDSEDDSYMLKRLDKAFEIEHYIGNTYRDTIGSGVVNSQMTACEIADILLSLEKGDTLVIADQGSAGCVLGARKTAKRLGIKNSVSGIFYFEPLGLDGKTLMYHALPKNKIFLRPGEEEKIMHAHTAGGPAEEFKAKGGDYYACTVAEIESLVSESDDTIRQHYELCTSGGFGGCAEHKRIVKRDLGNFLKQFE